MINAYEYAVNRAKFAMADCIGDELVMMAADIGNMEEQLKEIRRDRWQMVTISLNRAGTPAIQIIDGPGFKQSLESEDRLMENIRKNRAVFAALTPVLNEAQEQLRRFSKPTITVLGITYRNAETGLSA